MNSLNTSMPDTAGHDDPEGGGITLLEAFANTLIIGLIAALALGWFDLMIPWTI